MPDGSKFIGDNLPTGCAATMSIPEELPSSHQPRGDDGLSKTAADGRMLIERSESERKADQDREDALRSPRDSRGRIKRSSSARSRFLVAHGLTRTPPGCQIDHIVPPAKRGPDVLANMQLLCGETLREKEATELR